TAIVAGGAFEVATTGTFLGSYLAYVSTQLNTKVSSVFGTQTTFLYVSSLMKTSAGLMLLAIPSLAYKKTWWLWVAFTSLLTLHSLSPHKEYRFIVVAIPLQLTLVTLGVTRLAR